MDCAICLFDVDGVLVKPGGYRAAVKATMEYFLSRIGVKHDIFSDEIPVLFEALGVTSEWDMLPISLALVLEAVCSAAPPERALQSLLDVMDWAKGKRIDIQVDLKKEIGKLSPCFLGAEIPSEAVLRSVLSGNGERPLPHLSISLVEELFENTRSVEGSWITRVFQNYVLGSADFQEVYRIERLFESESFLKVHDQLLLDPFLYRRLCKEKQGGNLCFAAYTARPSLPPKEIETEMLGYSPEAEQGLLLVDPELMPLIGYGRLAYLAQQMHVKTDTLLKPAPLQALAALAAAVTEMEYPSLIWALDVFARFSEGKVSSLAAKDEDGIAHQLQRKFSLHVFEDSSIGITAGRRAADLLNRDGFEVDFHAWGIATEGEKQQALLNAGAKVFPDVDSAVLAAFSWTA
ncbi:MAG: hypothetical protein K8R77_16095 [Anaerolineaceae bacterium]|nr:hypothetical protein [Anaerolineaceae bacterium]